MINELLDTECIKYGSFLLKSGELSKYYFDMKMLVSYPKLLKKIGDEMYNLMSNECTLLCGVLLGGLPICSYISTKYEIPMIMVRDEIKSYGTNKQIEGLYNKNDKCIIIEDVVTTGGSVNKIIDILKDKVNIIGVIVILNRQECVKCEYPIKSVINKTDIIRTKLNQLIKTKNSRLCFSADIDDKDKLIEILDKIGKNIIICKIHYDFYDDKDETLKKNIIEMSIKHDFLILEDRKFVDISYTVSKQYKKFSKWVDMITVMSDVDNKVIENLSGVLLVANMSNKSYNNTEKAVELSEKNADRIIGFITQYKILKENMFNMTPGINIDTNQIDDQCYRDLNNIDTDIIIVGRGIYNSSDYVKASELYKQYKN